MGNLRSGPRPEGEGVEPGKLSIAVTIVKSEALVLTDLEPHSTGLGRGSTGLGRGTD